MKDIPGFEGLYAVTSCGKVWSYRRQKFLKPQEGKDRYLYVNLIVKRKAKRCAIHRLVAEAYLPNPNNYPQVNHIDECGTHNWLNNLEWCDAKYNCNYGTRVERIAEKRRKKVYCVETNKTYDGVREAGRELNISHSHISAVCIGKESHTHVYHFRYVEGE